MDDLDALDDQDVVTGVVTADISSGAYDFGSGRSAWLEALKRLGGEGGTGLGSVPLRDVAATPGSRHFWVHGFHAMKPPSRISVVCCEPSARVAHRPGRRGETAPHDDASAEPRLIRSQ